LKLTRVVFFKLLKLSIILPTYTLTVSPPTPLTPPPLFFTPHFTRSSPFSSSPNLSTSPFFHPPSPLTPPPPPFPNLSTLPLLHPSILHPSLFPSSFLLPLSPTLLCAAFSRSGQTFRAAKECRKRAQSSGRKGIWIATNITCATCYVCMYAQVTWPYTYAHTHTLSYTHTHTYTHA